MKKMNENEKMDSKSARKNYVKNNKRGLLMMKSIGTKLLLNACISIVVVGIVAVTYITSSYQGLINNMNVESSEKALITLDSTLNGFESDTVIAAKIIASEEKVISAIESRNSNYLRESINNIVSEKG